MKPFVVEPPTIHQTMDHTCWAAVIMMISQAFHINHKDHHIDEKELLNAAGIDTSGGYGYALPDEKNRAWMTVVWHGAKWKKSSGRRPQVRHYTGYSRTNYFWPTEYQYQESTLLDYDTTKEWKKEVVDQLLNENYIMMIYAVGHERLLWSRKDVTTGSSTYKFKDPYADAKAKMYEKSPAAYKAQIDPESMTWEAMEMLWGNDVRITFAVQIYTQFVWLGANQEL